MVASLPDPPDRRNTHPGEDAKIIRVGGFPPMAGGNRCLELSESLSIVMPG